MRVVVVLCAACVLHGCVGTSRVGDGTMPEPVLPRIPRDAARFEIDQVSDSTATFRVQEARWVKVGLPSYAVDPSRRDALVARLTIIARDSIRATALITGQVARVRTDHFLLVVRPDLRWWRSRAFWTGVVLGGTVGAAVTAVSR